jgi:hypothetical protein
VAGLDGGAAGLGMAQPCDAGAHACARVLASQGRGLAVLCAGHRYPGPAARRGGGGSDGSGDLGEWCDGSLHKSGTTAEWGKGPRAGYGGIIGGPWLTAVAEGIGEEWLRRSPVEAGGDRARNGGEVMPWRGGAELGSAGSSM